MKAKLFFIALLIGNSLFAQFSASYTNKLPADIKSPGVSDFVRSGNVNVNTYIGETNYSIPLVNIGINNQNPFMISLGYNSSGFRPTKRSGIVGLNWFLNVGGSITREVNNYPDDHLGQSECSGCGTNQNGLLVGVRDRIHNTSDVLYNMGVTGNVSLNGSENFLLHGTNNASTKKYEASPDTFNFNFNGISGKFFIGIDGQIKVVTNEPDKLKVDLSGMPNQPYSVSCKPLNSEIRITDSKGNKYYFGGESKALEYNINLGSNSQGNSVSRPTISTWYLTKIEYYNGFVINYIFKDDSGLTDSLCSEDGQRAHLFQYGNDDIKDFVSIIENISDERYIFGTGQNVVSSGPSLKSYQIQKKVILDQITGPNFSVVFNYSRVSFPVYEENAGSNNIYNFISVMKGFKELRLDKIVVSNGWKNIDFSYSTYGTTGKKRMLLTSVTEQDQKKFQFEYYYDSVKGFPTYSTFGIDHWGYWNGNNQTATLIASGTLSSNGDYSLDANNVRIPNFNFALQGQLKKIIYPTKGYTMFEYDTHTYSKRLERKAANSFLPSLTSISGSCGGTRIKKITNNDGVSNTEIKEFSYSGGILLKYPRYSMVINGTTKYLEYHEGFFGNHFWSNSSPVTFNTIKSNAISINSNDNEIITYSEVTENTNGNGKVVKKYRNYETNPDSGIENIDYKVVKIFDYYNFDIPELEKNTVGVFLNDRKIERGKIAWEKIYDVNNSLKQEIIYEYNEDPSRFNNWTVSMHQTGTFTQVNKMFYYPDYLTKTTTKTYENNAPTIVQVSEQVYDYNNNTLVKEVFSNSENELIEKEYTYTFNSTYNLLLLERTKTSKNNVKLYEESIEYGNSSDPITFNKYLPKKIAYSKFPNDNLSLNGLVVLDPVLNYLKYDEKGNPLEMSFEDGIKTVYLWGYNKSKLIAKIENSSFAQVASALGISETQLLNYNESNITQINNLRTNSQMGNTMITTYLHNPLVGVYSITDPKNDVYNFVYDELYRLKYVIDSQNKVVSENKYNFKQ